MSVVTQDDRGQAAGRRKVSVAKQQGKLGLVCPKCSGRLKVYRTDRYPEHVRRVRVCLHCGHEQITIERLRDLD